MDANMVVSIEYCESWNYLPQATSLAAVIKSALGAEVQLLSSSGGCFEVVADGELVFSKNRVGRFPTDEEVLSALNG